MKALIPILILLIASGCTKAEREGILWVGHNQDYPMQMEQVNEVLRQCEIGTTNVSQFKTYWAQVESTVPKQGVFAGRKPWHYYELGDTYSAKGYNTMTIWIKRWDDDKGRLEEPIMALRFTNGLLESIYTP